MRAFIAINLDESVKASLTGLSQSLAAKGGKIKWIKRQGMHLTLKFLGEIAGERVPEIESIIKAAARNASPFPLSLKGVGTFPVRSRFPRVLWVGIESNEVLQDLHADLESGLERIGFPREKRPFHPHLTLGRVNGKEGLQAVLQELSRNENRVFGEMTASKITLFQSVLKPTGAEYSELAGVQIR